MCKQTSFSPRLQSCFLSQILPYTKMINHSTQIIIDSRPLSIFFQVRLTIRNCSKVYSRHQDDIIIDKCLYRILNLSNFIIQVGISVLPRLYFFPFLRRGGEMIFFYLIELVSNQDYEHNLS